MRNRCAIATRLESINNHRQNMVLQMTLPSVSTGWPPRVTEPQVAVVAVACTPRRRISSLLHEHQPVTIRVQHRQGFSRFADRQVYADDSGRDLRDSCLEQCFFEQCQIIDLET